MRYLPEVERGTQSIEQYWRSVVRFAVKNRYAPEYIRGMVKFRAISCDADTITLAGPAHLVAQDAPGIGWWLEHQLPIWTGMRAVLVRL
jgi:hypothetical protein